VVFFVKESQKLLAVSGIDEVMWRMLVVAAMIGGGEAWAATPASSSGTYLQTAPEYNFGSDPFAQNVAPVQNAPPGTVSMVPPPVIASAPAPHIHGYVAAGVSTGGGAEVSAGVMAPLVPGKLDLGVEATTGTAGNLPHPWGTKPGVAHFNAYQATLNWHPTDDFQAMVAVGGVNFRGPYPYGP